MSGAGSRVAAALAALGAAALEGLPVDEPLARLRAEAAGLPPGERRALESQASLLVKLGAHVARERGAGLS